MLTGLSVKSILLSKKKLSFFLFSISLDSFSETDALNLCISRHDWKELRESPGNMNFYSKKESVHWKTVAF